MRQTVVPGSELHNTTHSLRYTMKIINRFQGNGLSSVSLPLHRSDPPEAKRRKRNDDRYNEIDDGRICCCNSTVLPMALDDFHDDWCTNDDTSVMEVEPSPQAFVETLLQVCT
jgi:hypothetical protein